MPIVRTGQRGRIYGKAGGGVDLLRIGLAGLIWFGEQLRHTYT